MNSYKLNGMSGHMARQAIVNGLGIHHADIYKVVKSVHSDVITLHDGRKFKLELKYLGNE